MTVRATRVRRLRIRRAIGRTLLIAAICAAGMVYVSIRRQGITLVVDGRPRAVPSMDGSVGQLLVVHGIAVDSSDEIVPEPSTALADGMTVTVDTKGTARSTVRVTSRIVVNRTVRPVRSGVLGGGRTRSSPSGVIPMAERSAPTDCAFVNTSCSFPSRQR